MNELHQKPSSYLIPSIIFLTSAFIMLTSESMVYSITLGAIGIVLLLISGEKYSKSNIQTVQDVPSPPARHASTGRHHYYDQ